MVNVGDTVYLIYVGLITVQSVSDDGEIAFYLYDDKTIKTASRAQYRTLDRMDGVRHLTKDVDYTIVASQ